MSKKDQLKTIKAKKYRIYGIFNFQTNKLEYVGMDLDKVILEFDLEGYDEELFDIIYFDTVIV